ncbi:hypothetical protein ACMA1I_11520 [Pontibacter sp. 13R65]|uniref:hypothetical protein n=1 Tax=Pontibacter sp. 13R65 TaxID=3127458 RepID=UPI00301D2B18
MILYQNSLICLNYDPSSDIIVVEYKELHNVLIPEIKHSIHILIETVKNYDIKRILLDSSQTKKIVNEDNAFEITMFLAKEMLKTRIQKVARLQSPSSDVENSTQSNWALVKTLWPIPFDLQDFRNKQEALLWLKEI